MTAVTPETVSKEPIAIIGLGCVLPDAPDVDTFWNNLQEGRNSIREVPKERWDPDLYWSEDKSQPDRTYAKIGAFVSDDAFDGMLYRMPPKVVEQVDPCQRWALSATRQALLDAGLATGLRGDEGREFDRDHTAVIIGNAMGGETNKIATKRLFWPDAEAAFRADPEFQALPAETQDAILARAEAQYKSTTVPITEDTMPGHLSNVIAGRVANAFDLGGKNFTTDAACASSLAALDGAVDTLRKGEANMVVWGGTDRSMDVTPYIQFSKIGALSPDGSRPFDKGANGFVMGEGCAMFLLKRLSDAERDGDRIYAVVRGIGGSSDGKGKGITAPNPKGQVKAVLRAYEDAEMDPYTVGYLEAHGTSTPVGDPVELESVNEAYSVLSNTQAAPGSIAVGSVKSNIGHLKAGAGAAGILKTVLALHHGTLPPSINVKELNPRIDWSKSVFTVQTQGTAWKMDGPRKAAVSSFGFGGTNFHVVMQQYVPGALVTKTETQTVAVATTSSFDQAGYDAYMAETGAALEAEPLVLSAADAPGVSLSGDRLRDAVHPYTKAGVAADERVGIHVDDPAAIPKKLELAAKAAANPAAARLAFNQGVFLGRGAPQGKVAFLFPGQGTQYVDMGRDLAAKYQVVADTFAEADKVLFDELGGINLTDILWPKDRSEAGMKAAGEKLRLTEFTQPAVLAMDIAILRLLKQWGVSADVVAGHSLGEYGALVAAGCMSFAAALEAVACRGREMANVKLDDLGKMVSVSADWHAVDDAIQGADGYVICANKNCPSQTVIAGSTEGVAAAVEALTAKGIQTMYLPVSAAFHSEIVAPASGPLRNVLGRLEVKAPTTPLLSNVGAEYITDDPDAIRDNLAVQVASPVDWVGTIERMYAEGVRTFIEVGPKRALTGFVADILKDKTDFLAINANHPKKGGIQSINELYAFLGATGYQPTVPALDDAAMYTAAFRDPKAAFTTQTSAPAPVAPAATEDPRIDLIADRLSDLSRELDAIRGGTPAGSAPPVDDAMRARAAAFGINLDDIGISGISVGLPGTHKPLFDDGDWDRILRGENLIDAVPADTRDAMVDKHIVRLVKGSGGQATFESIDDAAQVIRLAAQRGEFDLADWGVGDLVDVLDKTSQYAMAAGLEALRDAGIPLQRTYIETSTGGRLPKEWKLPEPLRDGTGIIFASAFPGYDRLVDEMSRHLADKYAGAARDAIEGLYEELTNAVSDPDLHDALRTLVHDAADRIETTEARYEFNRKFLFAVLSMGHSQLAQFLGARGPNTQVNAACASTTQAIGIAEDWIRTGRARRVLVVGADDATSPNLFEWIGSGFLASGAATTKERVEEAALPFDARRHGMIVGMGAVGVLVEAAPETEARGMRPIAKLLATKISNSAFHGSRLDVEHIAGEMQDLVATAGARYGVDPASMASSTLFMSHETYTPARGGSAAAEIHALRATFGAAADQVVVANTKGFTGHPQGAGVEDAVVLKCLQRGQVPPIPHLKERDPELGNLRLSEGGSYDVRYGLRLAAGFGSQVAMTLTELVARENERFADAARYEAWLGEVSGQPAARTEVVHRTLRIVDDRMPATSPEPVAQEAAPVVTGDALAKVTQVVAEKTGYPIELLEADLDLEADLGIDTVKQAELFGELREMFGVPLDEELQLKDYNTLRKVADYMGGGEAPTEPASTPNPVAATPSGDALAKVTAVVAEKTGYPVELLEADLDLEADLGIDTVKQAELFGELREMFGVPLDEKLQLKDYNTLRRVADYMSGGSAAPPAPIATPEAAPVPSATPDALATVTAVVAEKTGYPVELLEADLDLEADLGIDTVKQAELFGELREMFGVPLDENLSLADYNTLRKVAEYMGSGREAIPPAASTPAPTGTTPPATESSSNDALATVTAVVAEKTGYPVELLEPDLDMEADLGIDTVKQAELFGELREHFGVPLNEELSLADYNTLRKVADYMGGNAASAAVPSAPAFASSTPETEPESADPGIRRLVPASRPVPLPDESNDLPRGDLLVIGDTDRAFLDAWKEAGWNPDLRASEPVGLLCLATRPGTAPRDRATALFEAAKAHPGVGFVAVVTCQDGEHGLTAPRDSGMAALNGLTKALRKELPDAVVKSIDVHPADPNRADHVVPELLHGGARTEVCYGRNGTRKVIDVAPAPLDAGLVPDVVGKALVVAGGAQGITAELLQQLAPQGPKLLLLGRTNVPDDAATWATWDETEWKTEEGRAIQALKDAGEAPTPVKVRKIVDAKRKAADVHDTINRLTAAGAEVLYAPVDVTDAAGVSEAVSWARERFGAIHGVIHAAGIEISKLLADKPREQFDLVFDIKQAGLDALLAATADDDLELLVGFGSVAGRFGNIGQTDYSAANEALAKGIVQAAQDRDIPTAFTVAWGPWGELGMATRGGIMTVLKASGVTPIPTADGMAAFMAELATAGVRESVVAGVLGDLDLDGQIVDAAWDPAITEAESWLRTAPESFRLLHGISAFEPGRSLTADVRLDRATDPYLFDHAVDGVPLLPGVFGIEAFAQAGRLLASEDLDFLGAADVRFASPLKQHKDTPVTATLTATVTDDSTDDETRIACTLTTRFIGPDGRPHGEPRTHFEATIRYGAVPESLRTADVPVCDGSTSKDRIYPPFFHGPSFQVLSAAGPITAEEATGDWLAPEAPCFAAGDATFLSHPLVTEGLFQLCGLRTMQTDGAMSLPAAIDKLDVFAPAPRAGARLWCRYGGMDEDGLRRFDAAACTPEGRVIVRAAGYAMVESGPVPETPAPVAPATAEPAAEPTATLLTDFEKAPSSPSGSETATGPPPTEVPLPEIDGIQFAWAPVDGDTSGLHAEEAAVAAGFATDKRRLEWMAGRRAVKAAVTSIEPSIDPASVTVDSSHGAPRLFIEGIESPAALTITHRDGIAIAAIADDGLGIDLETIEERAPSFWDQAFGADEQAHLRAQDDPDLAAAAAWAAKEACLKRHGTGLTASVHALTVQFGGDGAMVVGPFGTWGVRFFDVAGRVLAVTAPSLDTIPQARIE